MQMYMERVRELGWVPSTPKNGERLVHTVCTWTLSPKDVETSDSFLILGGSHWSCRLVKFQLDHFFSLVACVTLPISIIAQ